jgi:hypothetical protein
MIAKERQIQHLGILGDSLNTIRSLVNGTMPRDIQLNNIIKTIRHALKDIPQVTFRHILRENNGLVYAQANLATLAPKGAIWINGRSSHLPIP